MSTTIKLFIRPTFKVRMNGTEELLGFAVCTTNTAILVDEQIIEHFPLDATGIDIKKEFPMADWGMAMQVK